MTTIVIVLVAMAVVGVCLETTNHHPMQIRRDHKEERRIQMLNRATLIGRLGADPEIRYTQSGEAIARFNLATSERWKDKEGNTQESTEWHKIVAWGRLAEICGEHLAKGKLVYIEGPIKTRKWDDKDGNTHYSTEIVARSLQILDRKNNGSEAAPEGDIPF